MRDQSQETVRFVPYSQESSSLSLLGAREAYQAARSLLAGRIMRARIRAASYLYRIRSRARSRGFEEGYQDGADAILKELFQMEHSYKEMISTAKSDCISIAMNAAEEILAKRFPLDVETLTRRIDDTIEQLLNSKGVRIHACPQEVAPLCRALGAKRRGLEVYPDVDLSPGNAKIETDNGNITLDWRRHLNAIKTELMGQVRNE